MRKKAEKAGKAKPPAMAEATEANNGFLGFFAELQSIVIPKHKWQLCFSFAVIFVSASYWIGALIILPPHTFAEAILYRPCGDTEYYPIINALSHFNFGDPTDSVSYGRGLASYPFIGSLPHAMACALFGKSGFIVADIFISWLYFLFVTLFLRACGMARFPSLIVGSALATNGLQVTFLKLSEAFNQLLGTFGVQVYENGFPGLFNLSIFEKRIPRPMIMEIIFVLLLYCLIRLWRRERTPSWRDGIAIGALFGLLIQGDFYSSFTLGMVFCATILLLALRNQFKLPLRFLICCGLGALATGWIFVLQRLHETPDIPRRYGLARYSREHLLWLPGYAPLLRLGIICILAIVVYLVLRSKRTESLINVGFERWKKREEKTSPILWRPCCGGPTEKAVAGFFLALMVAAYFAQPVQILLLGKGTQIYHYLLSIPVYYSYGLVVLLCVIAKLTLPIQVKAAIKNVEVAPSIWGGVLLALLLLVESILAMGVSFSEISNMGTPRGASPDCEPWAAMGNNYRPNLRVLEGAFSDNPAFRNTQTFATFDFDVNVLLTTFHGKHAYNPDPFLSTLTDDQIESRICTLGEILGISPDQFGNFIQMYYIVCYSIGHNKYHFASDHKYSTDDDYSPENMNLLSRMPKQWGWTLVMPNSEVKRMTDKYVETLAKKMDSAAFPDLIILTLYERNMGLTPNVQFYDGVPIGSQAFYVYLKKEPFVSLENKAQHGDALAQLEVGRRYLVGEDVGSNPTNAFSWFGKSAFQGLAGAELQMGVCYAQGIGTAKDFAASIPWFRKAAAQGNVDAQYNLGLLYENGLGVKQDLAEAAVWYQRAGEKGHVLAQNSLGLVCFNVRKDYAEAEKWFRKAAEQGNALAQNSLGVLYLNGLGVKPDANEALKWFQQSAQQGFAEGQNNCALVFYGGQRYNESAQWFHKAADQGHVGSQYNLAQFYQKGLVYSQDLGEASLWYSRAAKQGYGLAQLALGKIYHAGQGVKVDDVEAYKWFKLARLQGVSDAEKELTNCAAAMTKEQISAAEEEVKQAQKQ